MAVAECSYLKLIRLGATPQEARSVLPNSSKTEIVVTMNLREWQHFFKLRASPAAHPQMQEIATPMLATFQKNFPIMYVIESPMDTILTDNPIKDESSLDSGCTYWDDLTYYVKQTVNSRFALQGG